MSGRRVEIQTGVGAILFRFPNLKDLKACREPLKGLPTLPDPDAAGKKAGQVSEDDADRYMEMANVLLMRCAMRPRLLPQDQVDPDSEGEIGIEELSESDRGAAFTRLLAEAGFTKEAREDVGPFSETAAPS